MDKSNLGDRMKDYEKRFTDINLVPRLPVIIRLDGKSFHSYTRMFKKTTEEPPFSKDLKDAMVYAIKKTCNEGVSGVKAIYQQSDEISFYIQDDDINAMGWYDYNVQKMTSVISSIFTAYFNQFIMTLCNNRTYYDKSGMFDARCFNLPNETEVNNYMYWRQVDFYRNSINMVGRSYFSHREMNNLNTNQVQEKLFQEKNVNWNDLDVWKKRGVLVIKKSFIKDVEYMNKKTEKMETQKDVLRNEWTEVECPIFTKTNILKVIKENKYEK